MDFRLERRLEIIFHPTGVHNAVMNTPNELYEHLKIFYDPKKNGTKDIYARVELRDSVIPRDFRQGDEVAMQLCDGVRFGPLITDTYSFFGKDNKGIVHFTKNIDKGNIAIWLPSGMEKLQRRHVLESFEILRRTNKTYRLFLTHAEDRGSYIKKK